MAARAIGALGPFGARLLLEIRQAKNSCKWLTD
jgi:hypothetical protein